MSLQALVAVIESREFKGAEYAALVALANYADQNGYCYPSYGTLARDARTGESTIKRAVKSLLNYDGEPLRITRQGGGSRSNLYQINLDYFEAKRQEWRAREKELRRRKALEIEGSQNEPVSNRDGSPSQKPIEGSQIGPASGLKSGPKPEETVNKSDAGEHARDKARSSASLSLDDWREIRQRARNELARDVYSNCLARTAFVGGRLQVATRFEAEDLKKMCGAWLKGFGVVSVVVREGGELIL